MKTTIKIFAFVLLAGLASAFTYNKTIASGYKVGDIATDFSLKNIDNKKVA